MTFEEWLGNQIDERNEIYAEIGQECYDNGYQQGRTDAERDFQNSEYWNDYLQKIISDAKADAIEEFISEIDLDKPMHFTKEQTAWIKKYVILKRQDAIEEVKKIIISWSNRVIGNDSVKYISQLIINEIGEQYRNDRETKTCN